MPSSLKKGGGVGKETSWVPLVPTSSSKVNLEAILINRTATVCDGKLQHNAKTITIRNALSYKAWIHDSRWTIQQLFCRAQWLSAINSLRQLTINDLWISGRGEKKNMMNTTLAVSTLRHTLLSSWIIDELLSAVRKESTLFLLR